MFEDDRGSFFESYNQRAFTELGIAATFVQDNQSRSKKGVLRGVHYQVQNPQGKLVRVLRGSVFDVAVDLRRSSRNFGKWAGFELSEQNRHALWVPPGFGHAFFVLSKTADVVYKVTDYYSPESERTLVWNDPDVGIEWPIDGEPVLSAKDARGQRLHDCDVFA